jgi:hypothetical protein
MDGINITCKNCAKKCKQFSQVMVVRCPLKVKVSNVKNAPKKV